MPLSLGQGTGPLKGLKVVELAGIGPGPHACMLLADLGADVIRVDRPGGGALAVVPNPEHDLLTRGRPSVAANLKDPVARDTVLDLVAEADVLVEGLRPGVTERLGLGPDECLARNPRLVYGRMTGWGQHGPLAARAGHDVGYVAVAGALHGSGQDPTRPHFASNLVGDFGGGSTYLVIGILAALLERGVSGRGQVVDAAIVDGTAHLNTMAAAMLAGGALQERRAANALDGGLPYYDLYATSDGEHMAVGALEPQFFAELVRVLELDESAPGQVDLDRYDDLRDLLTTTFASRTRDEWTAAFEGTDACVAPVLRLSEAADHPHLRERGVFVERDGVVQPAPAPRFSRTEPTLTMRPSRAGEHTRDALEAWGVADVDRLIASGAFVQA
ncbi:CaiB/BaiF CoA-transferase family protein [Nocardioides zeae]|uniref:CaiB/BaiF CoA-transferase family protein n=1 Tax=Nocardioides imazamoxiresistens TaxID=3231893 RepID=A0ABU3PV04_9ACTN|nr:CaiB/BaiF CoA-transferase family protein [Nocardioides zeae]MDT9593062.1 CaiB/BaiF CoA-transferase family protein [Nocardioides zeae]